MAETTKQPTERTLRWRRLFFGVPRPDDGRLTLAELGRELGGFTYLDPADPSSIVKGNVWKMILGRLGIINASSLDQCLELVNALATIPPVAEEIRKEEE